MAGLLFGAAVALLIASIVLFSAGASRWAQYSSNGYAGREGSLFNFTTVQCGATGLWQAVFGVYLDEQECVGAFNLLQPARPFNETLALIALVQNLTYPRLMYAPSVCLSWSDAIEVNGESLGAACFEQSANFAYPAYAVVFIDGNKARSDSDYWFGIWVAFLVIFCIAFPFVVYVMVKACKDSDSGADGVEML